MCHDKKTFNILTGLLIWTGIMQARLKNIPQIVMLLFGAPTLISFLTKKYSVSTTLFYILTGTMLFVCYFLLTPNVQLKINQFK